MRYIYKWKCIVTNADAKQFYLTRYNQKEKANIYNLVPMCKEMYDRHIKAENPEQLGYRKDVAERHEKGCEDIKRIKEKRGFVVIREK